MIFGHCTTHSQGLKSKWLAWEGCQFSIGTPFIPFVSLSEMARKMWFFTFRLKVQYAPVTLITFEGRNTSPRKKKRKPWRRPKALAKVAICSESNSIIDVSVPSFDYAIPRFFSGYLAAAIFCKSNRDYLLSVLLKVGVPLCLIPKRAHVSNCSNRAKKMQAGCQKYLVPWPFFRSTWKCGETPISSFSTLC